MLFERVDEEALEDKEVVDVFSLSDVKCCIRPLCEDEKDGVLYRGVRRCLTPLQKSMLWPSRSYIKHCDLFRDDAKPKEIGVHKDCWAFQDGDQTFSRKAESIFQSFYSYAMKAQSADHFHDMMLANICQSKGDEHRNPLCQLLIPVVRNRFLYARVVRTCEQLGILPPSPVFYCRMLTLDEYGTMRDEDMRLIHRTLMKRTSSSTQD